MINPPAVTRTMVQSFPLTENVLLEHPPMGLAGAAGQIRSCGGIACRHQQHRNNPKPMVSQCTPHSNP